MDTTIWGLDESGPHQAISRAAFVDGRQPGSFRGGMRLTWGVLLTVVAVRAFSGPTGVPTGSSRKATSAEPKSVLSAVALGAQNLVVELFEFEHKRAAKFERTGQHEYWADPRIHNFGNLGWRGILHALVVPIATHAIDRFAYSGVDARRAIHESEFSAGDEVVDLCCGVGFSSARTGHVVGVDTSPGMLGLARLRRPDVKRFEEGNAETWGEDKCCDVATVMFGMHEMPADARRRIIRNALRLARKKVLIVDIWPGFEPSPMMLSGEPFVLDYLANIEADVVASHDSAGWDLSTIDVVPEHVRMWRFDVLDWGI